MNEGKVENIRYIGKVEKVGRLEKVGKVQKVGKGLEFIFIGPNGSTARNGHFSRDLTSNTK